jgi:hypothetical protein
MEFAAGEAVRMTWVPELKAALQAFVQSIPSGLLLTVPVPVPENPSDKLYVRMVKLAVTVVLAARVTVQVPVPLQAPPHPLNIALPLGVAVSLTCVLGLKLPLHDAPQLIPAGLLVMLPLASPETLTISVKVCDCG